MRSILRSIVLVAALAGSAAAQTPARPTAIDQIQMTPVASSTCAAGKTCVWMSSSQALKIRKADGTDATVGTGGGGGGLSSLTCGAPLFCGPDLVDVTVNLSTVPLNKGGTGATSASAARTALGCGTAATAALEDFDPAGAAAAAQAASQPLDSDLSCFGALSCSGLLTRTGPGTCACTATSAYDASGAAAAAQAASQPINANLTALAAMSCNGVLVRTGGNAFACRTLTGAGGSGLSWSNADGVSGSPTVDSSAGGDGSGQLGALSVVGLRGKAIDSSVASAGAGQDEFSLVFDNDTGKFLLRNVSGGGGGGVAQVNTGPGLSGGPITTSGQIDVKLNASGGLVKNLGAGTDELGIGALGVTNAMLAGSIANGKLANSQVTINGTPVSLGGSISGLAASGANGDITSLSALAAAAAVVLAPYGASAGNTSEERFLELAANGTNYTGFKAPDSLAANVIYVLPSTDGTAGQVLKTNGSKVLSWVDQSGGGGDATSLRGVPIAAGAASPTLGDMLLFDGSAWTLAAQNVAAPGASGNILVDNGAGLWASVAMSGDASIAAGGAITLNTVTVSKGGTGRTSLTNHGLLVGAGASAITQLAAATNGQIPIGSTGADPALATLTGTANRLGVTNGAGSITLNVDATQWPSSIAGDGTGNKALVATGANSATWQSIVNSLANGGGITASCTNGACTLGASGIAASAITGTAVVQARTVTGTNGVSGGGDLSANRTLSLDQAFAATWTALETFARAVTSVTSGSAHGIDITPSMTGDGGAGGNTATPILANLTGTVNLAATGGSNTSGYTALLVNVVETAIGSGVKKLLDLEVGGVAKFFVTNAGLASMVNATVTSLSVAGIVTNTSGGVLGTVDKIPVANGGTNSSTALVNGRIMTSVGGAIVEGRFIDYTVLCTSSTTGGAAVDCSYTLPAGLDSLNTNACRLQISADLKDRGAGGGTVALTVGTSSGGNDLGLSQSITSGSTANGTTYYEKSDGTELGSKAVSTKAYLLYVDGGSTVYFTLGSPSGTVSGAVKVRIHLTGKCI